MTNITPWTRRLVPTTRATSPFAEMERLMDDVFGFSPIASTQNMMRAVDSFAPRIDVAETEKAYTVHADLPGISEKDLEVTLKDNLLTLKGERKQESEEKHGTYTRIERSYGSSERQIGLSKDIDQSKIDATFKNGVLTLTLPKLAEPEQSAKKINVKAG